MENGRTPLSRDRVLAAAVDFADEHGVDRMSMRRLGAHLGVEAMSLYHHVADKSDILDGMIDIVISDFDLDSSGMWAEAVRRIARSARDALIRHPWASGLMITHIGAPGPHRLRYMDVLCGVLRSGGFSAEATHHAFHVLDGYIKGSAYEQVSFQVPDEDFAAKGAEFLAGLDESNLPHLAEHVRGHVEGVFDEASGFDYGLDFIIDGLTRIRQAP